MIKTHRNSRWKIDIATIQFHHMKNIIWSSKIVYLNKYDKKYCFYLNSHQRIIRAKDCQYTKDAEVYDFESNQKTDRI